MKKKKKLEKYCDLINDKLKTINLNHLWANLADDKLLVFLFFPESRFWHFMQIVSNGDNLHEM